MSGAAKGMRDYRLFGSGRPHDLGGLNEFASAPLPHWFRRTPVITYINSVVQKFRALAEINYAGYVTTELQGGDAAYLKDVSTRVDRFLAGEKPYTG